MLNAANSTVGQLIIQLCSLLQLRCVAVVREREQTADSFAHCTDRLKVLGATHVIQDRGSLKVGSHAAIYTTALLASCTHSVAAKGERLQSSPVMSQIPPMQCSHEPGLGLESYFQTLRVQHSLAAAAAAVITTSSSLQAFGSACSPSPILAAAVLPAERSIPCHVCATLQIGFISDLLLPPA